MDAQTEENALPSLVAELQGLTANEPDRAQQLRIRRLKNEIAEAVRQTMANYLGRAGFFGSDSEDILWASTAKVVQGLAAMEDPLGAWLYVHTSSRNVVNQRIRIAKRDRATVPVDPTGAAGADEDQSALLPWDPVAASSCAGDGAVASIDKDQIREAIRQFEPSLSSNYRFILRRLVAEEADPKAVAAERHGDLLSKDPLHAGGSTVPCTTCRNWVDANFKRAKAALAAGVRAALGDKGAS